MADIVAETERLVLRTFMDGDAEIYDRHLNTPAVMARLGGVRELPDIAARIEKSRADYAREGYSFLFMLEKPSGEVVGQCGIKRIDNPLARNQGDLEIGWMVREDRWRRGYAAEAMAAVLEWAFTRLAAPRVVAQTSELNEASWRLMERLGMTRRPDLFYDDPAYPPEDRTTIVYTLERAAWEARK